MQFIGLTRRRFLELGAAATAAMAVSPHRARAADPATLRIRSASDIQCIDPVNPAASADQDVMAAIFNNLITYKPGTEWGWELQAATAFEEVDPTHYKFTLMPNVMWTNGFGEMTTEDVKFSFERIIDPAIGSWASVDWQTLDKVEIVDKYNGVIVLKEPFAPLLRSTLPYGSGCIVCKKAVEALENKQFTTEAPASSGPYKIEEWTPKQKLVLTRHDGWPGPKPAFDRIEIHPIEDAKVAEIGYESGDLDMTAIPASSVKTYRAKLPADTKFIERPSLYYTWLGMNVEHKPFDDPRVRKAVQLAIDVDAVIESAYFGVATRATGIIGRGLIGYREKSMIEKPNLEEARKLLAEAGLADGFKTTLDVQNITDHVSAAQIIQANLAEVGIEVEVNPLDSGTFWTLGIEKEGDSWKNIQLIYNRYNMAPDPSWATAWFVPEQVGEWNWERWKSPEFGELNKQAVLESDPDKRHALYVKMQDLMEESGAYVFITHDVNAFIHRDNIVPALRPDGGEFLFRSFKTA